MKKLLIILLLIPVITVAQDLSKLELKDLSGKKFIMKNHLNNDATIILFWATWCLPCKKEFPAVQNLIEKHTDKKIKVITISQDTPRSLAKVKSFAKSHQYNFTYLLDPGGDISSKLLVNSVPYTFLLNAAGKVIYNHRGYRKGDEIELEKHIHKYWNQQKLQNQKGNSK